MTSPLDSHSATDVTPDILSGVLTGKKFNMMNIYVALDMRKHTEKTIFSFKDN